MNELKLKDFSDKSGIAIDSCLEKLAEHGISANSDYKLKHEDQMLLIDHVKSLGKPDPRIKRHLVSYSSADALSLGLPKSFVHSLKFRDTKHPIEFVHELARSAYQYAQSGLTSPANFLFNTLSEKNQECLARWYRRLGLRTKRLETPDSRLPNAKWMLLGKRRRGDKNNYVVYSQIMDINFSDVTYDFCIQPFRSNLANDRPWFDDQEIEERGHSVRAFRGGATGLKR